MNANLYATLSAHFPQDSAAPCLILPDGRVWTYGDIERASARMAHLIVALGLEPGDRVAAQVEKTPEALVLYLAALRAGMVFLPLNPAYQRHEIEDLLDDAKPGLFVCRPQSRTPAFDPAARAGVPNGCTVLELDDAGRGSLIDAAAPHADTFKTVPRQGGDLAAILYTSGTTSRSKGAMLSHANLAVNAQTLHMRYGMTEGGNVFVGYWRMPEKTQEEFTADGYVSISGRSRDLIISGGLNVYPKEIEELIDALPGVAESAVVGLPHPDFGEAVTAVVARKKGKAGAALSATGIIAALKGELANFKLPKNVFLVDDLPRNAMGKVQKNTLRQRYSR